jgi:hypothetical protein
MHNDFYKELAKLRLITAHSIMERSKRPLSAILKSVDSELTRIANSINKGYTLGPTRIKEVGELYRPYKYFNLTTSLIQYHDEFSHSGKMFSFPMRSPEIEVKITRGSVNVVVTDENLSQLMAFCTKWKVEKPTTLEDCNQDHFYMRWW